MQVALFTQRQIQQFYLNVFVLRVRQMFVRFGFYAETSECVIRRNVLSKKMKMEVFYCIDYILETLSLNRNSAKATVKEKSKGYC